jgi:hypothetical protein
VWVTEAEASSPPTNRTKLSPCEAIGLNLT